MNLQVQVSLRQCASHLFLRLDTYSTFFLVLQGLDSVSAARIVAILQSLARDVQYPTTIIASIHQPSSRLYQTFDTVLVLAQGKQLYFGPGGHAPAAYFESRGHVCPPGYNVADHLLEIASSPPGVIHSLEAGAPANPSEPQGTYRLKGVESRTPETPGLMEKGVALDSTVPTLNASSSNSGSSGLDVNDNSDREENIIIPVTSKISHKRATTFFTQLQVLSGREVKNLQR
jgi:ABC-type multidrug transport system ATPase subunit